MTRIRLLGLHALAAAAVSWWYRGPDAQVVVFAVVAFGLCCAGPSPIWDARGGMRLVRATVTLSCLALLAAGLARLVGRFLVGFPPITAVSVAIGWVGSLLGLETSTLGGTTYIRYSDELLAVRPDVLLLGLPLLLVFAGLAMTCEWVVSGRRPRLGHVIVAASVGVCLSAFRLVVWLYAVSDMKGYFLQRDATLLWETQTGWVSMLSMLIVTIPTARIGLSRSVPLPAGVPNDRRRLAMGAIAVAAVAAAGAAWSIPDAGVAGRGEILVDDSHCGDWEIAGVQFTPEWRGDMSVYACSALFEHLGDTYHVRVNRTDSLSTVVLQGVDVLVLRVPDRPYDPSELAAIRAFVHDGGGLFVVGDHTDLFGCNSFLNDALAESGIRLEPTAVSSLHHAQAGIRPTLGLAPVEEGADEMEWLTGCDLSLGPLARPLVVDTPCIADGAVWSNSSYFGDGAAAPGERCGPLALAAAAELGKGRVVVLSDATIMTNFAAFLPGRQELLRNLFAHVSRRPARWSGWRVVAALFALTSLLLCGTAMGEPKSRLVLAVAAMSVLLASQQLAGSLPAERARVTIREKIPRISFLGSRAHYYLAPTIGVGQWPATLSYDTLFVEVLRAGFRPRFNRDLDLAMREDVAIIVPNVMPSWSAEDQDAVRAYVLGGGILWLLAGSDDASAGGAQVVASALGVVLAADGPRTTHSLLGTWTNDAAAFHARTWMYGVGRGVLCVTTGSEAFSRGSLGHPFPVPKADQAPLFATVDEILSAWRRHLGARPRFTVDSFGVDR